MKIYVMVDIEGISGISCREYVVAANGRPDLFAESKRLMALDINACIEGCFQGGATEVIVRDCHGDACNVKRSEIDPRADLISGDTPRMRMADMDGAAGLILLGYHAMAGTLGAVLEHTMSSGSYQHIWLNGRETGEIGIDAAIAAEHNVPVIMVSGDDKTCKEAEDWLPGVVTCETKKGYSCYGCRMSSLEKSQSLITEKTAQAVRQCKSIKMLKLEYPVEWKVEMVSRKRVPDNTAYRIDDCRTYALTLDSVERAFFYNW